jgi:hypothetical protein
MLRNPDGLASGIVQESPISGSSELPTLPAICFTINEMDRVGSDNAAILDTQTRLLGSAQLNRDGTAQIGK